MTNGFEVTSVLLLGGKCPLLSYHMYGSSLRNIKRSPFAYGHIDCRSDAYSAKYCTSSPIARTGLDLDERSDITPADTRQCRIRDSYNSEMVCEQNRNVNFVRPQGNQPRMVHSLHSPRPLPARLHPCHDLPSMQQSWTPVALHHL